MVTVVDTAIPEFNICSCILNLLHRFILLYLENYIFLKGKKTAHATLITTLDAIADKTDQRTGCR